jgi:hypothetical protein
MLQDSGVFVHGTSRQSLDRRCRANTWQERRILGADGPEKKDLWTSDHRCQEGGVVGASACAALVRDLKQRGLLDETIVLWGGGFGRTPMV